MGKGQPYGAVFVHTISSECTDSLWKTSMHKYCNRIFKLHGQLPSGQNPTEIGICDCYCHNKDGFPDLENIKIESKQNKIPF